MKKIFLVASCIAAGFLSAQFNITVQIPQDFNEKEAILYTLNGSKDIASAKGTVSGNSIKMKFPTRYLGMMKLYLPNSNNNINFISENKDVNIKLESNGKGKISNIVYLDEANNLMNQIQDLSQKQEMILPALNQIKDYYKDNTDFSKALTAEIQRLNTNLSAVDPSKHPFISFYNNGANKFLSKGDSKPKVSQDDVISYIEKSGDMLESSSLLRPILLDYLNSAGNANVTVAVDKLIDKLNVETPRGQVVLSEIIDIFDAYGMNEFKDKYLNYAKNLKCTINDRLNMTITSNANVALGATFPDYKFQSALNTTAKSIKDVKADKKIIVFWSSTCSHCETELPKLLKVYNELKTKNVQVIGLSLDSSKENYLAKANIYPWINDSELKGWNSSYVDTYNVHATPNYFILDANNKIISKPDHVADVLEYFKLK